MRHFGNVYYVLPTQELMWFVVGLIAGAVLMAVIDFVIDRSKK